MAASSSKLLNLRNPTLQILLRRHLLHPSAAAAQSINLLHPENTAISWPKNSSPAINLKFHVANLPQLPIEAARGYSPKDDGDNDVEDDEDDFDDEDDDEINIDELSGLELEFEDEDEDDDEVRPPVRK